MKNDFRAYFGNVINIEDIENIEEVLNMFYDKKYMLSYTKKINNYKNDLIFNQNYSTKIGFDRIKKLLHNI